MGHREQEGACHKPDCGHELLLLLLPHPQPASHTIWRDFFLEICDSHFWAMSPSPLPVTLGGEVSCSPSSRCWQKCDAWERSLSAGRWRRWILGRRQVAWTDGQGLRLYDLVILINRPIVRFHYCPCRALNLSPEHLTHGCYGEGWLCWPVP